MSKNNEKQNKENLLKKGSLKNKIIFEMRKFMIWDEDAQRFGIWCFLFSGCVLISSVLMSKNNEKQNKEMKLNEGSLKSRISCYITISRLNEIVFWRLGIMMIIKMFVWRFSFGGGFFTEFPNEFMNVCMIMGVCVYAWTIRDVWRLIENKIMKWS